MSTRRIILGSILSIIVVSGLFIGVDYHAYKIGNRSHLFSTLNNYQQNQTLKFGSLNLKVTSITLKPYPKPNYVPPASCPSTFSAAPTSILSNEIAVDTQVQCAQRQNSYAADIDAHQHKNNLTVNYSYANVGNLSLNTSKYKLKLVANTGLTTNYDCAVSLSGQILKGSTETGCLSTTLSNVYHGPIKLVVTQGSKEKDINLKLD